MILKIYIINCVLKNFCNYNNINIQFVFKIFYNFFIRLNYSILIYIYINIYIGNKIFNIEKLK